MRVKLTNFKNDYDNDNEPADKFKKLDPRRAELAGKNNRGYNTTVLDIRDFGICELLLILLYIFSKILSVLRW